MRKRLIMIACGGLGLCLVAWGGVKGAELLKANKHASSTLREPADRLPSVVNQASDAGVTFAYAELAEDPNGKNMAEVIYALEDRTMASPDGKHFVHNSSDHAECVKYLSKHPELVDEVLNASTLEYCELPYNYEEKPFATLEKIRPFTTTTRILITDAKIAYQAGDYERFARSILAADRILWRLGQEPGEKPFLTYAGEELRLSREMLNLLQENPAPEGARAIQQVIASMKAPASMKPMFQLESAKTLQACDLLYEMDELTIEQLNVYGSNREWTPPNVPFAQEAIKTRMLEFWMDVYGVVEHNADPMQVGLKVDELVMDAVKKADDLGLYMVRTMPANFEQHGKVLKRSMEVRRAVYAAAVLAEKGDAATVADVTLSIPGFDGYEVKLEAMPDGQIVVIHNEGVNNEKVPAGLDENPITASVTYRRVKA